MYPRTELAEHEARAAQDLFDRIIDAEKDILTDAQRADPRPCPRGVRSPQAPGHTHTGDRTHHLSSHRRCIYGLLVDISHTWYEALGYHLGDSLASGDAHP